MRFKNQGLDLIEVQDNGSGISPANYPSIALKHHTSKLSSYSDIASLQTFGFRGEALASLCALSSVTITTCLESEIPKGSKLGFELSGKLSSTTMVPSQKGTTVSVENLFHNLPVRRRELQRNVKREWHKVIALLNQYACILTNLKFSVSQQPSKGKRVLLFSTKSNPTTRENIINIFGSKTMSSLVSLDLLLEMKPSKGGTDLQGCHRVGRESQTVRILGHVSRPIHGDGRQTPDRQMFFVNGRPSGLPQFAKAFNDVYKTYNSSQAPFIFANIQLDTNMYDVNVSPDKRSILLHDQGILLDRLRSSLVKLFDSYEYQLPAAHVQTKESSNRPSSIDADGHWATPEQHSLQTQEPRVSMTSACDSDDDTASESGSATTSLSKETVHAALTSSRRRATTKIGPGSLSKWLRHDVNRAPLLDSTDRNEDVESEKSICDSGSSGLSLNDADGTIKLPQNVDQCSDTTLGNATEANIRTSRHQPGEAVPNAQILTLASQNISSDISPLSSDEPSGRGSWPLRQKRLVPGATAPQSSVGSHSPHLSRLKQISEPPDVDRSHNEEARRSFSSEFDDNLDDDFDDETFENAPLSSDGPGTFHETWSGDNTKNLIEACRNTLGAGDPRKDNKSCNDQSISDVDEHGGIRRAKSSNPHIDSAGSRIKALGIGPGKKTSTVQALHVVRVTEIALATLLSWKLPNSVDTISGPFEEKVQDITAYDAESKLPLIIAKNDFAKMRIVGQFNLGFIIAVRPKPHNRAFVNPKAVDADELFIIDQHASDEKFNFERLQSTTVVQSQRLVQPKKLELTALEEEIVLDNLHVLDANGFKIQVDSTELASVGARCHLLALPLSRETTFTLSDLDELIALLAEEPSGSQHIPRPSRVRKMFAMRACRSSIMIGKALTSSQMYSLVGHMGELDKPWNCPHGRPTMRHLCSLPALDRAMWADDVLGSSTMKSWLTYSMSL